MSVSSHVGDQPAEPSAASAAPGAPDASAAAHTYPEPGIRLLAEIWEASGYLCGVRLMAALPHGLPWLKRRIAVAPTVEVQLRRISPRQIDRRLGERRQHITRRLYGTTRPGA